MREIKGQVWCDMEGQVHDNEPDPFQYGPITPQQKNQEPTDGIWELRNDPDYTESALYFYICPGEHRVIWEGRVTK